MDGDMAAYKGRKEDSWSVELIRYRSRVAMFVRMKVDICFCLDAYQDALVLIWHYS